AIRYLPVSLAHRIVGNHFIRIEELRRHRKHALAGGRNVLLTGEAVAESAIVHINLCASSKIYRISLHGRVLWRFSSNARMHGHPGHFFLKRHRRGSRSYRSITEAEVDVA